MKTWISRAGIVLLVGAVVGGGYLAMREKPVPVDVAQAVVGPMQVFVEQEGVTRVKDIYTVSSPITGYLGRTELNEGQYVRADETTVAAIYPLESPFLDDRTIAGLEADAQTARAAIALAKVEQERAAMGFELAKSNYERTAKLADRKIVSDSQLERSYNEMKLAEVQIESANASITLRETELMRILAQMNQPDENAVLTANSGCCIRIKSPVNGVVLQVVARSEQAVVRGTPVLEIGDPKNLEIVVDLLSRDAPKLNIGAKVEITGWGGDQAINGTIRRIDPAAFTKVSALGIEEQRVNVILDIDEVPDRLSHGYRVLTKMQIWAEDDVLQIPIGALFRTGGNWSVFTVEEERATLRNVTLGQMNSTIAQVLDGLEEETPVILYPNDLLEDGGLVINR